MGSSRFLLLFEFIGAQSPVIPVAPEAGDKEGFRKYMVARMAWQRDVVAWSMALPPNDGVMMKDSGCRTGLVSLCPSNPGKWRITRFIDNEPWGHGIFNSREKAVLTAVQYERFTTLYHYFNRSSAAPAV